MALFKYDSTSNKLIPITSEGSVGLPVGAVLSFPAGTTQAGWLLCDGSTFDRTVYPALYTYLGNSNVLPDYRECVLVGAGQNDTDAIAEHDVYTLSEFKDDQIQNITGTYTGNLKTDGPSPGATGAIKRIDSGIYKWQTGSSGTNGGGFTFDASRVARTGTTTHGKQKGVAYYIKATSAGPEVEPDIYATKGYVNDAVSYSTDEQPTGGTWIDGKPIYKKVTPYSGVMESSGFSDSRIYNAVIGQPYIDTFISATYVGIRKNTTQRMSATFDTWIQSDTTIKVFASCAMNVENIISLYTKTTD